MRGTKGWAAGALLLFFLLTARQTWAHASLLRAEPAANAVLPSPPAQILLEFTETLDSAGSAIELLDDEGQRVPTLIPSVVDPTAPKRMALGVPPLADGVYTVSWRALSAVDGHITRGAYGFVVGEATQASQDALAASSGEQVAPGSFGEASPLGALARALTFVGGALLAGGFVLQILLWQPVRATLPLASHAGDGALARLLAAGVGLAAGGTALLVLSQSLLLGSVAAFLAYLTGSFGVLLAARLALLALLGALIRRVAARGDQRGLGAGAALTTLLLGAISLGSHSAGVPTLRAAALLNDWLHLVAASVWVGGLAHLGAVSVAALRPLPADLRASALAALIRRFSPIGIAAVAALAVTGLYSGWLHVGSLEALRTTAYGQTLLTKLLLSVPLVALAGLNLLHWRRVVATTPSAERGFTRTLGAETAIGLAILLVVGLLTALSPARGLITVRQSQSFVARVPVGPLQGTLAITPPHIGPARYEVTLREPDGTPYDRARSVRLRFIPPDASIGVGDTLAEPLGEGRYVVEGAFLTLPGLWQVELQVQRPDGFDAFAGFNLEMTDTLRVAGADDDPTPAAWFFWLLLASGAGLTLFAVWLRPTAETRRLSPLVGVAGVALLGIATLQHVDPLARPSRTPVSASALLQGQQLYGEHCLRCHGPQGLGDGPQAEGMVPPPANLHEHLSHMTDDDVFRVISEGIPPSAMPPHQELLSEAERWQIVWYVRSLVAP